MAALTGILNMGVGFAMAKAFGVPAALAFAVPIMVLQALAYLCGEKAGERAARRCGSIC